MVLPNITRRLFMKGIGALASKVVMPKMATKLLPDVKEAVKMDSAPWINSMVNACLLYTSPSPRDGLLSRMPSSA